MLLYIGCVRLLYHGPSDLVVKASDWYSRGSAVGPKIFSVDLIFLSLSLSALLTNTFEAASLSVQEGFVYAMAKVPLPSSLLRLKSKSAEVEAVALFKLVGHLLVIRT